MDSDRAGRQAALDSLAPVAAVVDSTSVVRLVNQAWRAFADENGLDDPTYGVGTPYSQWAEQADANTAFATKGLIDVIDGGRDEFTCEYPCDSPTVRRRFRFVVLPLELTAPRSVLTLHIEVDHELADRGRLRAEALRSPTSLGELVTVCAWCEAMLRRGDGTWVSARGAGPSYPWFSHGMCPDCEQELDRLR